MEARPTALVRRLGGVVASLALLGATSCTFTSTADHWNGLVGPSGKPIYVKTDTSIGINLLIFIPFLGRTTLPHEIEELTRKIAEEKGNTVRMVESSSENYWYGFSPFTWIVTPVVTTVSAEYEPSGTAGATGTPPKSGGK